jgi:hypothetical protein
MSDSPPRDQPTMLIVTLSREERQFLALAIQGLCVRQGPPTFAVAMRVTQSLGLQLELAESLQSWVAYAQAQQGGDCADHGPYAGERCPKC